MNKKVIDCFLHIPTIKSSSYPPIQWMEIKDKNDMIITFYYIFLIHQNLSKLQSKISRTPFINACLLCQIV